MTPVAVSSTVVVLTMLAFYVYCLYDFARTDESEMRTFPRQVWLALLVFTNVFGGLMWLYLGRPQPPSRR
jgi:hypothetical protein